MCRRSRAGGEDRISGPAVCFIGFEVSHQVSQEVVEALVTSGEKLRHSIRDKV